MSFHDILRSSRRRKRSFFWKSEYPDDDVDVDGELCCIFVMSSDFSFVDQRRRIPVAERPSKLLLMSCQDSPCPFNVRILSLETVGIVKTYSISSSVE